MNNIITSIAWKSYSPNTDEPTRFMTKHVGKVYSGYGEQKQLIAKFRFYYLDLLYARSAGYSVAEVIDNMDETFSLLGSVYDIEQQDTIKADVAAKLRIPDDEINVLYFDALAVLPAFRGKGLTNSLLEEAERLFAGRAAFSALICCPLQFATGRWPNTGSGKWKREMDYKKFEKDRDLATDRLSAYYQTLGFNAIPGSDVMVREVGRCL